ncbi:hypothetical protein [Clostridium pasteurianum]|uniref:LD-carboxypeptidase n=1 Tax=Clostridium pasteurianum BC1 TaxID=86416 RepID=R4K291_CLOPA|nr:hypothetical protein [Clostridium pasteurianum]AGK97217.1 hypothetical protein Clopa_2353 [Clostridium pasteurianum BC1]
MIIPEKLKIGDEIRVIAPSRSFHMIDKATRVIADKCLKKIGLKVTFSNADFGHTNPRITFPIGEYAELIAEKEIKISIKNH